MSERTRRYALIEAPSVLGLKPTGVERLPAIVPSCSEARSHSNDAAGTVCYSSMATRIFISPR